jgi:hypothetical protein
MKEGFQSKFIREMLWITKERVAYLGMKVPITPDIKQVEGTGRAHEYSYRNLLQFAIVEWLTEVGLSMRDVKYLLSVLENASEIGEMAGGPTPVNAPTEYIPKKLSVDVTAWPPRKKKGLIVGVRDSYVYIHEPDRVKNAFENYFSPSSDGELHFIMTKPGLPPDNDYILAITDDIAEFAQVISNFRAPTQMLINMKEIKFRVNVYIDVETWEPDY